MRKATRIALLSMLATSGYAHAANSGAADFGVYASAGTTGLGGGIAATFGSYFGARIGYTSYEHKVDDLEESGLTFDGKAKIGGMHALLDWHPFGGNFRLSAGAIENASLSARVQPIADTYTLNGTSYSADDIGDATGAAEYESISPYAGVGFGRALSSDGRFAFSADLGVVFTGSPEVELNATCRIQNAMLCAQIEDDVATERAALQDDADELEYWPVLSLGLSYKF
jgi:hypothetical protein